MGQTGIVFSPSLTSYPTCSNKQWNDGDYVLNPGGTNTFRAVGSGTAINCSALNGAGSGSQIHDSGNLYWQEVGSNTNYIVPVGYLVLVRKDGTQGQETVQDTGQCNTPIQVGSLRVCKAGTTFVLTTYNNGGTNCPMSDPLSSPPCGKDAPTIDSTHPLIVLGERPNSFSISQSTFMARAQDLTADANNIAGEACLYVYAQEQSGCYGVNAVSGTEASIAAIGPGSQNSMLYDFVASNPSNASGPYYLQRLAGVFIDSRNGEAMKTVLHGTITPYSNPSGAKVSAGLKYIGKADITMESVHTENVTDGIFCDGDDASSTNANCFILSTDPASGSVGLEVNTVHIGSRVNSYFVNTVKGGSTNALQDDTIVAGLGNCNSGQFLCYTQSGSYQAGTPDAGSARTRIPSAPLQTTYVNGPLFLSSAGNGLAGSVGFLTGNDVSGGWPTTNVATIEAPPTPIPAFTSYHITLPAGASSGILQGSNSSGLVTGTFSGDSKHSKHLTGEHQSHNGETLCPSTSGGCDNPSGGLYRVSGYMSTTSTNCSSGTSTATSPTIGFTDNGNAKSIRTAMTGTGVTSNTLTLGNPNNYGIIAPLTIWSTGPGAITYTVTYTPCIIGTADYELDLTVEQIR